MDTSFQTREIRYVINTLQMQTVDFLNLFQAMKLRDGTWLFWISIFRRIIVTMNCSLCSYQIKGKKIYIEDDFQRYASALCEWDLKYGSWKSIWAGYFAGGAMIIVGVLGASLSPANGRL